MEEEKPRHRIVRKGVEVRFDGEHHVVKLFANALLDVVPEMAWSPYIERKWFDIDFRADWGITIAIRYEARGKTYASTIAESVAMLSEMVTGLGDEARLTDHGQHWLGRWLVIQELQSRQELEPSLRPRE
jgi:hypothetical protein